MRAQIEPMVPFLAFLKKIELLRWLDIGELILSHPWCLDCCVAFLLGFRFRGAMELEDRL